MPYGAQKVESQSRSESFTSRSVYVLRASKRSAASSSSRSRSARRIGRPVSGPFASILLSARRVFSGVMCSRPVQRVFEAVVAPEDLAPPGERRRAEDAEPARRVGLGVVAIADLLAVRARDHRIRILAEL